MSMTEADCAAYTEQAKAMPPRQRDIERSRLVAEAAKLASYSRLSQTQQDLSEDVSLRLTCLDAADTDARIERSAKLEAIRSGLRSGQFAIEGGAAMTPAGNDGIRRARSDYRHGEVEGPKGEVVRSALSALDASDLDARSGDRVEQIIRSDFQWAAKFAAVTTPEYERGFLKMLRDPQFGLHAMTDGERDAIRAAMSVGSNTNGGYLVPTHLDPTVILTSSGWTNPLREISRVVTLTGGANTWNGVTSAGVVASFDAELAEVSDDSPGDFGRVSIPTHKAQAFVQYSIEAEQDIDALREQLVMLLSDSKGDLEASKFSTGSGTGEPTGIWTALDANTNVELTSTTAATIGLVDLHGLYTGVPVRWRRRGKWLMNPAWSTDIKELGTAISASYSGDLREPLPGRILGHEVVEDDDAPASVTTTALDNRIIFGDFSNFVIVDKAGMSVELVPHILGTNRRPIGARGLYAHWRVGSEPAVDNAFRLLQDKTSV